jgi:hypothetical protein
MAYYLVRARLDPAGAAELRRRLDRDELRALRPFGEAITRGLAGARVEPDGRAVWEEEDYCSPPLAMERAAVLDRYFTELSVESVARDAGWRRIETLPSLWS